MRPGQQPQTVSPVPYVSLVPLAVVPALHLPI